MVRTRPSKLLLGGGSLTLACALALGLGACGSGTSNVPGGSGGSAPSASGGAAAGGSSTGGASSSGGAAPTGGAAGTGGGGSGGAGTGGGSSGGTTSGGSSGTGGSDGSGECTRALLDSTLDAYFDALAAHDASTLPLSSSVKFTENADEAEIGESGLWLTAGAVEYSQRMLDVEACTVAAHAVLPDGGADNALAVRIKLEGQEITEVETIVVPPGTYTNVTANPSAIIDIADEVGWPDVVPEGERATRDEMIAWLEKYFSFFPQGVCNVTDDCTRLENGGGGFACGGGATCTAGDPGPTDNNLPSRLILADVETGVGIGMTIYTDNIDMHMFKMIDGEVHAVQAIFFPSSGESGWD